MKTLPIAFGVLGIGAAAYIITQQPANLAGTTGLVLLGLKNNPRYVQLGVFALFLAGAIMHYNSFSRE